MADLLPSETEKWQQVERRLERILHSFAYRQIRTPLVEPHELFTHAVGEHTDIVQKEMYTFTDQGDQNLCLRPEATASVLRAYFQHRLDQEAGLQRLYYMGPMYRRERPQKGRLRQFHQLGAEAIGSEDPYIDAEMISILLLIAKSFSLPDLVLEINTLGDAETRKVYRSELQTYLLKHSKAFSEAELTRVHQNPLRVLDSKNPALQDIILEAPMITQALNSKSAKHFDQVQEALQALEVEYVVNPKLVRGLDYYCHTAFELKAEGLGAQSTVGAGGRYDGLGEKFGQGQTPAIGFAMGLERLMLLLEQSWTYAPPRPRIDFFALEEEQKPSVLRLANRLREDQSLITSIRLEVGVLWEAQSVKSALRLAHKQGSRFVVLLGPEEEKKGHITLKDLQKSEQWMIPADQLVQRIKEKI